MKRAVLLLGVVLLLAACGGGGNSDADQVKQAWTSFFSTKTSVAAHVALLQDGSRFRSVIAGFLGNQLAKSVKEKLSVIQKIEIGKMTPDTRLCRALEHELKIKLLVPHKELSDVPKSAAPAEVTLGDIMRVKGKGNLNVEG